MVQQGTLGGPRDIGSLRGSNTQAAAVIDAMVEFMTGFAASWADYSADDFVEMGGGDLSADDAYWQADQISKMPALLAGADMQAWISYADRVRDVTR